MSMMRTRGTTSLPQNQPRQQPSYMILDNDLRCLGGIGVPGLSAARTLAVNIITTIQKYNNNNARLRNLAHSIVNDLIGISDCMEGRWNDTPAKLEDHLHEFERALSQILKVVKKYSKPSLVARAISLVNANDRETEINGLEWRVEDAKKSILLLIGLDNTLTISGIHKQGRETHAALLDLVDDHRSRRWVSESHTSGEAGTHVYARDDVALIRKILPSRIISRNSKMSLNVSLHEAERRIDGSLVLVKTYEGKKQHKQEAFITNLKFYTDHWDSSILQLVGASSTNEAVPFEVYHLPSRQVESFGDWIDHSIHMNPAETVLGLHDMRTSVKDLLDFQRHNAVKFSRKIFRSSLVAVHARGNRLRWSLIYAGDLVSASSVNVESASKAFRSLRWDPLVLKRDKAPERTLIASFTGGINNWIEDTRSIDTIIDTSMDVRKLGSVLLQNGYLGDCGGVVLPKENIALGDVGYVDEDGLFVVVGTVHDQLLSLGGRPPTWKKTKLNYGNGVIMKTEKAIVRTSNKMFNRSECVIVDSRSELEVGVAYNDLDDKHAWQLFERSACEIISGIGLPVERHELKLVYSIEYFIYMTLRTKEESHLDPVAGQDFSSGSNVHHMCPTAYIFENGDAIQIQESGAPALVGRLRPSFDAEPSWLDNDEVWRLNSGEERRNGVEMGYTGEYMAFYMQLPPSVSRHLW